MYAFTLLLEHGASSGTTVAGSSTGSSGGTAQLLKNPAGVHVDSAGNIYVADTINNRVQKWAPGASSGTTVAGSSTGASGVTAQLLINPEGVYVDSAGNIYVGDSNNNRVQKWAPGASSGTTVAGSSTASYGVKAQLLNYPMGVYVDSAGNIYVADASNHRVQKWAPGASSGTTVAGSSTGLAGVTAQLLNQPMGVYVDSAGNIYVADTNNHRVQKWAPDASSGTTVAGNSAGLYGITAQLLKKPYGVYVDSAGNIYVADSGNNRVQKWTPSASNGTTVAGSSTGLDGVTAQRLSFPHGVYVDNAGNIYVADTENNRIQRFCA